MKTTKISVVLPAGVVVGNLETMTGKPKRERSSQDIYWEIYDRIFNSGKTTRSSTTVESTEPITLTLEIPTGSEGDVIETLAAMIVELKK